MANKTQEFACLWNSQVLGLEMSTTISSFYVGGGDPNSCSYAHIASTLTPELSPSPYLYYLVYYVVVFFRDIWCLILRLILAWNPKCLQSESCSELEALSWPNLFTSVGLSAPIYLLHREKYPVYGLWCRLKLVMHIKCLVHYLAHSKHSINFNSPFPFSFLQFNQALW